MNEEISSLANKAKKLKKIGLSTHEIAKELNLDVETIVWLTLGSAEEDVASEVMVESGTIGSKENIINKLQNNTRSLLYVDVKNILGISKRLELMANILVNLIQENISLNEKNLVLNSGQEDITTSYLVAKELDMNFTVIKTLTTDKGEEIRHIDDNLANLKSKKCILIQNIITSGVSANLCLDSIKSGAGVPVGIFSIINRSGSTKMNGVPIFSLINILKL